MPDPSKRTFGGKQEGAGRKPKAPSDKLQTIQISVDASTADYLRSLSRKEAVALKREAARVLKMAEINSRII